MSLKQLMEAVSLFSQGAAARDEELHRKHGLELGLSFGDPASIAYLSDAQHTAAPLKDYLQELSLSEVKKLVTLMYAGRDVANFQEAGSLRVFHEDLKQVGVHDKSKDEYIRILTEKIMNLAHYFGSVVVQSQSMGIDPDAELAHVG